MKNTRDPGVRNKNFDNSRKNRAITEPEVWILAAGLSSRMGRDKGQLKFKGVTLIGTIRANLAPLKIKVLRKDSVERCGPLGGIVTVLRKTRGQAIIFLACDMPLVTGKLITRLWKTWERSGRPIFVESAHGQGFPFLLPKTVLPVVERQIASKVFSINTLAQICGAMSIAPSNSRELTNINTPEEWEAFNSIEG